jgi:hypothetical protein
MHFCPLLFVGRRDNPKSSPSWMTLNIPLGLVFSSSGLFSFSAAADAAGAAEAVSVDVCAISIDWLSQPSATAIRLINSMNFFTYVYKEESHFVVTVKI